MNGIAFPSNVTLGGKKDDFELILKVKGPK
jgi:hypothetical protein